jgi:adenylosuccinate synthase
MKKKLRVITGAQWGDEGKGKGADNASAQAAAVCRYQGANNAGHTLVVDGKKIVLQHIPSGILRPKPWCVLGNGMLVNPNDLMKEIQMVENHGIANARQRIMVARNAHLILPLHRTLDALQDQGERIGTTKKGIGPGYAGKANRTNLRACDILLSDFEDRVRAHAAEHMAANVALAAKVQAGDFEKDLQEFFQACRNLTSHLCDTVDLVNSLLEEGKDVLAEGAQGTFLDIDHGTYPFVTASNTTIGGVCSGLGVPASAIGDVYGVVKAYTTRVGSGPFPTELFDENGSLLAKRGNEFGSVTGRPRRCGWLDLELVKHAARINGFTELWLTKLDIMDSFDRIRMGTGYQDRSGYPIKVSKVTGQLDSVTPVLTSFAGWQQDTRDVRSFDKLPQAAQDYVRYIEGFVGVPITQIGVGPDREHSIEHPIAKNLYA